MHRAHLYLAAALAASIAARCELLAPAPAVLRAGTWGGADAGMIVTDSGAHLHLGCTQGELRGRVPLDPLGRFEVDGRHNITAYPVNLGVFHPARIAGRVHSSEVDVTVTVQDTINHRVVVLGPARLVWGREPRMGPCPICRAPGDAMIP
jgi:hypothetical protein